MSPLIFVPMSLPKSPSQWLTLVWLCAIFLILERRGEPRSVAVFMVLGFIVGLFYGGGDAGGFIGSLVGLLLGYASVRVSRKRD